MITSESQARPLWKYIQERESIRLNRAAGKPWPWTDDKILQTYKFTNVKRLHDRTTQAFLATYRAHSDAEQHVALLNCGVRRFTGTAEFSNDLGWLDGWEPARLVSTEAACSRPWTGAYMIRADAPGVAKIHVVVEYMRGLWGKAEEITAAIEKESSWRAGYMIMHTIRGFGGAGFMCKEVLQDYILWRKEAGRAILRDEISWTPVGPGARRGLNRLFGREVGLLGLKDEVYLNEISILWNEVSRSWHAKFPENEELTFHDVQFCLCEFDKYERVRLGQGKPRSLYHSTR